MGMFDYVRFQLACPNCHQGVITEFQSKDGPCQLKRLPPSHVDYFYGNCPTCGRSVEIKTTVERRLTGLTLVKGRTDGRHKRLKIPLVPDTLVETRNEDDGEWEPEL